MISGFNTYGDQPGDEALTRMLGASQVFLSEMFDKMPPRWLSFVGTSGSGKTFLAEKIVRALPPRIHRHGNLIDGVECWKWIELLHRLRGGNYSLIKDLKDANFLFLDDIGASNDTAFALEQLYLICELRNRKWTLLTSNKVLNQIAEQMDTRISSRLIRDRNICITVNVIDHALRPR